MTSTRTATCNCGAIRIEAILGDTASWKGATDARQFYPSCGSAMFGISDGTGEIEIRLGALDVVPTDLVPLGGRSGSRW